VTSVASLSFRRHNPEKQEALEKFLLRRMSSGEYEEMVNQRRHEVKCRLDRFLAQQDSTLAESHVHLVKGDALEAIPTIAASQGVELVVMGVVARSGPSGWITGNVTEQVLATLQSSVLALKPSGFVSPIKLPKEEADTATRS
jgi:nucleotide-binding universal stress UspA family protein